MPNPFSKNTRPGTGQERKEFRLRTGEGRLWIGCGEGKKTVHISLKACASSIILSHNHPSGNLQPSQEDLNLTKKLIEAGKLLDIRVLDHVIITAESYYSFTEE